MVLKVLRKISRRIKLKIGLTFYTTLFVDYDINAIFKGKKIAIVGPADSAFNTGLGPNIDQYDLVIRINKGARLLVSNKFQQDIGTRTDVLFHTLSEREGSGGKIDLDLLMQQKLKYIISYYRTGSWYHINSCIVSFLQKYRHQLPNKLILVPINTCKKLEGLLDGYKPTTGLVALYSIINSEFAKFYITGFTFFQTSYIGGYRDEYKEPEESLKKFTERQTHNPDKEFELFKKLYHNKKDKIILDDFLSKIT